MNENSTNDVLVQSMERFLGEVEVMLRVLRAAQVSVVKANETWKEATGNEYGPLKYWDMDNVAAAATSDAIKNVVMRIVEQRFSGLPYDPGEWAHKFAKAVEEIPTLNLEDLPHWFIQQVEPTARERIWEYLLKGARASCPRVGQWSDQKREAKLTTFKGSGLTRLTLRIYVWADSYGTWCNRAWVGYSLLGLEAVICHVLDPQWYEWWGRCARYLRPAAHTQQEIGVAWTHWPVAPKIRTYKNGRFDIWFRDEETAVKVKALLEGGNGPG